VCAQSTVDLHSNLEVFGTEVAAVRSRGHGEGATDTGRISELH
jgi:hypothetical protein